MLRSESHDMPESRKAAARKRHRAFRNIKRLLKLGVIDHQEHDRLFGELRRRYAG